MRQRVYLMKVIKRTFFYLLTFSPLPWRYSGKQFGVVDWWEWRIWIVQTWLEIVIQQITKICWILWFSRVSEAWTEVRLSEEIPGIRRYRGVGTVCSVVMLFGPGIDDRVKWQWALYETCICSSHLNICTVGDVLSREVLSSKLVDIWVLLLILFRALVERQHSLVNPRMVNITSWTSIHFPEVNWLEDSLKFQLRV